MKLLHTHIMITTILIVAQQTLININYIFMLNIMMGCFAYRLAAMESEHERLTSSVSEQHGNMAASDTNYPTFSHECDDNALTKKKRKCWSLPKRYIVALLAFLGFG